MPPAQLLCRPKGWSPARTYSGGCQEREFCATCWGAGKVYEFFNGMIQVPAVPCDECFGTGRSLRKE